MIFISRFGIGIIEDIDYDNHCYSINFEEYGTNRNLSFSAELRIASKSDDSNLKEEEKSEVKEDIIIEEIKAEFKKKDSLSKEEIEKLKELNLKLESANSVLEKEVEKLKESKLKFESDNDKLKEENEILKEEVRKLKEAELKVESNNSRLNDELRAKENEIERLNLQLEIKEQEQIIVECKFAFFGEKARKRKEAENRINELKKRF